MRNSLLTCVSALSLLIGGALPTFAQDAEETVAEESQLEEIVVTAQRRGENLQDVPIAVTAFTSERLAANGIQDTRDLVALTPSLQMPTQAGFMLPRLRGVGSTAVGPSVDSPVATYVDGIFIGATPSSMLNLGFVERVEILKGPQGTLFGRNATGGLIQVITPDPKPGFGANVEVGYANYQTPTARAHVFGGSDALSIGIQAGYSFQGTGYGRNAATGKDANLTDDSLAARVTVLANPTDRIRIRLSADHAFVKGGYPETRQFAAQPLAIDPNAPVGPYDTNNNIENIKANRQSGVSSTATFELGGATLVSITGWRQSKFTQQFDSDRTAVERQHIENRQDDTQFSQEAHVESPNRSAFKWLVGANYYYGKSQLIDATLFSITNPALCPAPAAYCRQITNGSVITRSYAGFAQGTYPITDTVNLTGGIRYTSESRVGNAIQQRVVVATGLTTTLATLPLSKTRYKPLTWRGAFDWKITPDLMLFGSVSRGFKSGGYNLTTPGIPAPFLPERLTAYEAGFKGEFLERKLRLNASGFYYDYNDILVTYSPVPGVIATINGAKAEIYGLDVDMEASLSEQLRIFGSFTAMRARFGDFPTAVFALPNANGTNTIVTRNAIGNKLPYTAEFTGTLGLNYSTDAFGGKLNFSPNLYYSNGFFVEADNLRRQPAYVNLGASLAWTSRDDFTVRLWGRNLTNEAVLAQGTSNNGGTAVAYSAPRTYGFTFAKKF